METRGRKRAKPIPSSSSSSPPVSSRTRRSSAMRNTADKGKSQDTPNAPDKILNFSFESTSPDDDNDSETNAGILHHNFTSASSALQGLLRKLGAGLDDLLPSSASLSGSGSHQSARLKKILAGIRADGEEGKQVEGLTQLCELLSIGTEDSLGSFSVDSFVPVLVGLVNHESNPDVMLLAARALTHLCDVLPSSCAAVVHYGAVPCFCARLLTIEYMDLAEQVCCFSYA